ncbi:tetratricopeptide repeat protein [Streptomyces sp. NPDC127066]|uniref:tetratricopeptide repeat protein n=1 Tax=Streptomyces sp. NPDC127066 TaxID=3347125 RepID=UPI0036517BA2
MACGARAVGTLRLRAADADVARVCRAGVRVEAAVGGVVSEHVVDGVEVVDAGIADRQRLLGKHPDTAQARGNLAASYLQAGRINDAVIIEEQVAAARERLLGPLHPDSVAATGALKK